MKDGIKTVLFDMCTAPRHHNEFGVNLESLCTLSFDSFRDRFLLFP
jgi:hypothetical protein